MTIRENEALINRITDALMAHLDLEQLYVIARNHQVDELYAMRDEELAELAEELFGDAEVSDA